MKTIVALTDVQLLRILYIKKEFVYLYKNLFILTSSYTLRCQKWDTHLRARARDQFIASTFFYLAASDYLLFVSYVMHYVQNSSWSSVRVCLFLKFESCFAKMWFDVFRKLFAELRSPSKYLISCWNTYGWRWFVSITVSDQLTTSALLLFRLRSVRDRLCNTHGVYLYMCLLRWLTLFLIACNQLFTTVMQFITTWYTGLNL